MLEGAGDRHQRFKRGQRGKHEQRNQRAGLGIATYAAGGEPEQQRYRQAAGQDHHPLRDPPQRSLLPLAALPVPFGGIQTGAEIIDCAEHHQFGLALQPGGQIGAVLAAQGGQLAANRFAGAVEYRWYQQQQQQQNTAQRQGQRAVQPTEAVGDHDDHHRGAD
ncbi:hypothetical protein D3C79_460010 [compost metagenome]